MSDLHNTLMRVHRQLSLNPKKNIFTIFSKNNLPYFIINFVVTAKVHLIISAIFGSGLFPVQDLSLLSTNICSWSKILPPWQIDQGKPMKITYP